MSAGTRWGSDFDPDELARLETRMWKAYYRGQPARLFGLLVRALHAQARVSWPRALAASLLLTRAAAGFARATGDYERFAPDIGRAYRMLRLPDDVDAEAVAGHELRWWVVRREIGLAAGAAAGDAITDLYATLYDLPRERVAEIRSVARDGGRGPRSWRERRPRWRTWRQARAIGPRSRGCCAIRTGACTPPWPSARQ